MPFCKPAAGKMGCGSSSPAVPNTAVSAPAATKSPRPPAAAAPAAPAAAAPAAPAAAAPAVPAAAEKVNAAVCWYWPGTAPMLTPMFVQIVL
jgi:hypothetical protein